MQLFIHVLTILCWFHNILYFFFAFLAASLELWRLINSSISCSKSILEVFAFLVLAAVESTLEVISEFFEVDDFFLLGLVSCDLQRLFALVGFEWTECGFGWNIEMSISLKCWWVELGAKVWSKNPYLWYWGNNGGVPPSYTSTIQIIFWFLSLAHSNTLIVLFNQFL